MSAFPDRSQGDNAPIATDINNLAQGVPTYEATRTYDLNRWIEDSGILYVSLVSSNVGNAPSSNPTKWEQIGFSNIALTVVLDSGTTRTLTDADNGKFLRFTNNSSVTITLPTGLKDNFYCSIMQSGTGVVSLSVSGTSLDNRQGFTDTAGQFAIMTLTGIATNSYVVQGDMA